jgi:Flp pilus assembly secretin CpaC
MPATARTLAITAQAALLAASLVAALAIDATRARLAAQDLVVRYDQSQLLRLPRNPAEIIIGNPSIADVAIQGGNLIVVTGKTFGVTNIIALDAERNVIQDQRVIVQRDDVRTVNLLKGAARHSYSCTPNCSPTLTIGDETTYFETISKHAEKKVKFSDQNSDQGAQAGGAQ